MKKELKCTYLFADGHAVQVFTKRDPDAGDIDFAEITEKFTDAKLDFDGRLIFGWGRGEMARLAQRATRISAKMPSIDNGSESTKKIGQPVGSLHFYFGGDWGHALYFSDMPGLISGDYTYQGGAGYAEVFNPELATWGSCRVARIHRVREALAALAAAAINA